MAIFTARGSLVKENINKKKVDLKTVYYRFKSGQGTKVRVLSTDDMVSYRAHSSFSHKIYTQSCVSVLGDECPLCVAAKSGVPGYDVMYAKDRYLFVFGDLATGELRVLDVSKGQAAKLIADITEYADDITDIAFNLKKIGEGVNTSYSLSPILKMKGDEPTQFAAFDGVEVTDEFLESVLAPRSREMQVKAFTSKWISYGRLFPRRRRNDR